MKNHLGFAAIMLSLSTFMACGPETVTPKAEVLPCTISANKTLSDINPDGVDYIVECDAEVTNGVLTIEPGVSIEFKTDTRLTIKNTGEIKAVGTSTKPITFAGTSTSAPSWTGVSIESNNPNNQLSFVKIQQAGTTTLFSSTVGGGSYDQKTALAIYGKLKMDNCSIIGSGGYGMCIADEATILNFKQNTFSDNNGYPVVTYTGHISTMDFASCSFSNNTLPYLAIYSSSSNDEVAENTTFNETPIPFMAINSLNFQKDLIFNAGAKIVFKNDYLLSILGDGKIVANGTAAKPVNLQGESDVAGYWKGLFVNTNNPLNVLNYTNIANGGSSDMTFGIGKTSIGIASVAKAQLTLNSCTAPKHVTCQVSVSTVDGTLNNNSPAITELCAH